MSWAESCNATASAATKLMESTNADLWGFISPPCGATLRQLIAGFNSEYVTFA
jgi:hypothetical protein